MPTLEKALWRQLQGSQRKHADIMSERSCRRGRLPEPSPPRPPALRSPPTMAKQEPGAGPRLPACLLLPTQQLAFRGSLLLPLEVSSNHHGQEEPLTLLFPSVNLLDPQTQPSKRRA